MSTGNIPPQSPREKGAEDVEQKLEERRPDREKSRDVSGESENERSKRDPRSSASHVATVAMYSRSLARARVCIYSDWRIVGSGERGRKMKRRDEIELRARALARVGVLALNGVTVV